MCFFIYLILGLFFGAQAKFFYECNQDLETLRDHAACDVFYQCLSHEDCPEDEYCTRNLQCVEASQCCLDENPIDEICPVDCGGSDPECDCRFGVTSITFTYVYGSGARLTASDGYMYDNYDDSYTVVASSRKLPRRLTISDDYGHEAEIKSTCYGDFMGKTFAGIITPVSYVDGEKNLCCPTGLYCDAPATCACRNLPKRWKDSNGDDCEVYLDRHYCTTDGGKGIGWQNSWGEFEDYAMDGLSAKEACCACGGGDDWDEYGRCVENCNCHYGMSSITFKHIADDGSYIADMRWNRGYLAGPYGPDNNLYTIDVLPRYKRLKSSIVLTDSNDNTVKIRASCRQTIQGVTFGGIVTVLSYVDKKGNVCCPFGGCNECDDHSDCGVNQAIAPANGTNFIPRLGNAYCNIHHQCQRIDWCCAKEDSIDGQCPGGCSDCDCERGIRSITFEYNGGESRTLESFPGSLTELPGSTPELSTHVLQRKRLRSLFRRTRIWDQNTADFRDRAVIDATCRSKCDIVGVNYSNILTVTSYVDGKGQRCCLPGVDCPDCESDDECGKFEYCSAGNARSCRKCKCRGFFYSAITFTYDGEGPLTTNSGSIRELTEGVYTVAVAPGSRLARNLEISSPTQQASLRATCLQDMLGTRVDDMLTPISYVDRKGNQCCPPGEEHCSQCTYHSDCCEDPNDPSTCGYCNDEGQCQEAQWCCILDNPNAFEAECPNECQRCNCAGGLHKMRFLYANGAGRNFSTEGCDGGCSVEDNLDGTYTVTADDGRRLPSEIGLNDGSFTVNIPVSCADRHEIVGQYYGNSILVVSFTDGFQRLCAQRECVETTSGECLWECPQCKHGIKTLTLEYLGEGSFLWASSGMLSPTPKPNVYVLSPTSKKDVLEDVSLVDSDSKTALISTSCEQSIEGQVFNELVKVLAYVPEKGDLCCPSGFGCSMCQQHSDCETGYCNEQGQCVDHEWCCVLDDAVDGRCPSTHTCSQCKCQGRAMISFTFEYLGDSALHLGSGFLQDNGDGTYTVHSEGDLLEDEIEIYALEGEAVATIDTTCSSYILGVTFAGFAKVVRYKDKYGSACCLDPDDCKECVVDTDCGSDSEWDFCDASGTCSDCECKRGLVGMVFRHSGGQGLTLTSNSGTIVEQTDGLYVVATKSKKFELKRSLEITLHGVTSVVPTDCSEFIIGKQYNQVTPVSYTDRQDNTCCPDGVNCNLCTTHSHCPEDEFCNSLGRCELAKFCCELDNAIDGECPGECGVTANCDCKGGYTELTFEYLSQVGGQAAALTANDRDATISYLYGSVYKITHTKGSALKSPLEISAGQRKAKIKSACWNAVLGVTFDSLITVIGYKDKEGHICSTEPSTEEICNNSCYKKVEQINFDIATCVTDESWTVLAFMFSMSCVTQTGGGYCQPHFDKLLAKYHGNSGEISCQELDEMGCCAASFAQYVTLSDLELEDTVDAGVYYELFSLYTGINDWISGELDRCQLQKHTCPEYDAIEAALGTVFGIILSPALVIAPSLSAAVTALLIMASV